MELREYWRIVRRRLWVVAALFMAVGLLSLVFRQPALTTYQATMRFAMGLEPEPKTGDYYTYDRYYTWLAAEYLIDDSTALVRSRSFAEAVEAHLRGLGYDFPVGPIVGSTQAGQLHRILSVTLSGPYADQLSRTADAVAAVLPEVVAKHFAQVGASGVKASLIDAPVVYVEGAGLRQKLDLPLRLVLAVVAGVGLTFALDYLDDTVHSRQELEEAGLAVLGEVPPSRRVSVPWNRAG